MNRLNKSKLKVAIAIGGAWVFLGCAGCATTRTDHLPTWWSNPHKHDEWHLYFTAEGSSALSYEDARHKARESIQSELREYMLTDVDTSDLDYEMAIHKAMVSPEFDTCYGNVEGKVNGTFYVWLMGRYPLQKYNAFQDRFGRKEIMGVAQKTFGGRVVGIYSCISSNGSVAIDIEGAMEINDWLVKNGVQSAPTSDLLFERRAEFDESGAKRIAKVFATRKVDVVFATMITVDSAKTGAKIVIPGSSDFMDALDAKLSYCIIRTSDGQILAADSTFGYSNDRANMLNVIMTHRRHFPNYATSIAKGLATGRI